jgi:hypothetical protein
MRRVFDKSVKTVFYPSEIGDYELLSLLLESPRIPVAGKDPIFKQYKLDLIYTNFSIFEDLYSNCLTGSLSLLDTNHLLTDFPIIGEETVQLCFRSMHTKIAIELRMRVTGISEIEKINENSVLYTLLLTSEVAIRSEKQKISRSFSKGYLSDIVSIICEKYLGLINEKSVSVVEKSEYYVKEKDVSLNYYGIETNSGHIEKYVVPNFSPFRLLNKLCVRASSTTGALFFFFQDINRFRFVNLEDVFKNRKNSNKIKTIVYIPKDVSENKEVQWNVVYDYKIVKRFDVFKNMSKGMYSSEINYVDIEKRNVETKQFYYQKDAKKYYHINNNKFLLTSEYSDITHDVGNEKPLTVSSTVMSHKGDLESQDYSDHKSEVYQRRMSMQSQIDSLVVQVEMAGDSSGNIAVGDIINFYVPRDQEKGDTYVSGNYLVTRIHHSVDLSEKYKLLIEMVTDTISESYNLDGSEFATATDSSDIFLEPDRTVVKTSVLSSEIVNDIHDESRKLRLQYKFNNIIG